MINGLLNVIKKNTRIISTTGYTSRELFQADLLKKSEQKPTDQEQFMLIEHLAGELESLATEIEEGRAPYDQQQKLTLEFYEKRISTLEAHIEKLRNGDH